MSENQDSPSKFELLRQQAEVLIQQQPDLASEVPSDILELIHELKIHQAELEIQNEELKRAQHELSELHREFQNLYEFAPCGYVTLNPKGIITRANLTAVNLLSTPRQFLIGSGFRQYIALEWADAYQSVRQEALRTGEKQSIELPLKNKNSPQLWVRADMEAGLDDNGSAVSWRIVLQDITSRIKSDEARQKSELLKNSIIESSPDCIKLLDLEGKLQYMSKGGQERLEIKNIGVYLNKSWIDFWKDKDNVNAQTAVDTALKGGTGTFRGYSPTEKGNPRWWDVIVTPLFNTNGEIEQLLAVSRDITKQKKMEDELLQAQKMESIGNLAGGIAHDFNNILSAIIGYTELALYDVEKNTDIEDDLQEVYIAGKRAKDLVQQILSFARQTNEALKPIQVKAIVKEVLKFIRSSIPTSIEIRQTLDTDSRIMGDVTQMHQILMNLLTNAAYAMENKGGTLEIVLDEVKIKGSSKLSELGLTPGSYLEIKVADTGTGIEPDVIGSIFEPYFTTKGPGEGTGMGLAVVHGIVDSYGGKIKVESTLGEGAIFTIYLPTLKQKNVSQIYDVAPLPTGSERILFVDDEAPIAKLGSRELCQLGYSVTTRTSSIEALELFKSKPADYDLVITDMTMPNLTGDKLSIELMKVRNDIPVILCTGYSKTISAETSKEMGIKAFAYKPFVKADLAKTVRKVLDEAKGSA